MQNLNLIESKRVLSFQLVALQKLCISFFFMFLMVYVEPMFPISKIIGLSRSSCVIWKSLCQPLMIVSPSLSPFRWKVLEWKQRPGHFVLHLSEHNMSTIQVLRCLEAWRSRIDNQRFWTDQKQFKWVRVHLVGRYYRFWGWHLLYLLDLNFLVGFHFSISKFKS